jgi:hypothetical protein
MRRLIYSFPGLVLAAGAANAQPTAEATGEAPAPVAHGAAHAQAAVPGAPAEQAAPAAAAAPALAAADVTDAEIDSFAKATVKLQAIQADATISADLKPAAMRAAVSEAGLDPAKYNAIGKAAQADPALRARVQTAMTRYATPPSG